MGIFGKAAGEIDEGDVMPEFALPDQTGQLVSLSSLLGKGPVVVFFYPRDDSPGCTVEVCSFRDQHDTFVEAGASVVGISGDDVASHDHFVKKYGLPFTLLSDGDNAYRKAIRVPSTLGIMPGRVTYVLDKTGVVQKRFASQINFSGHIDVARELVQKLSG